MNAILEKIEDRFNLDQLQICRFKEIFEGRIQQEKKSHFRITSTNSSNNIIYNSHGYMAINNGKFDSSSSMISDDDV
ncbi:hypothetical protein DERP_000092 [Dermatophagoides pteronyssinus]|uniref:Uncharacterized protein n=1 Tax=Dermatophagoides pteronyssinus TaxID=6956 RepID=A0ABQ8IZT9_DERPT|nr:hypothetical protein DERP_000092 [Dermatophagoides pteronyssinus]